MDSYLIKRYIPEKNQSNLENKCDIAFVTLLAATSATFWAIWKIIGDELYPQGIKLFDYMGR